MYACCYVCIFIGALLGHYTDPIYFNSIILGSLYHRDHMSRAMYARVTGLESLPELYRFNRPLLSGISNPESRQPGKAPNFSANWIVCDEGLEVITAMTGKTEQSEPSRVCKYQMFVKFCKLYGRIPSFTNQSAVSRPRHYGDAKVIVVDYQLAKQQLSKAFEKAGLGVWMKKPMEQDQFDCME